MFDHLLLEPEQEDLLATLVEASRNVPPGHQHKFLHSTSIGGAGRVMHGGLPRGKLAAYEGDIEALAREGLLALGRDRYGALEFDVAPRGFAYYQHVKQRVSRPVQRIETEVRAYLTADDFRRRHPRAYEPWARAEGLLWGSDAERQLTTIGHLCREALQEFATSLVGQYQPPDADKDKAKDINRIAAVLNQQASRLGRREKALLDALLVYWRSASGLVQRQEHGSQPGAEPLAWEDARRVVFQSAVVMFEVDRSLSRRRSSAQARGG